MSFRLKAFRLTCSKIGCAYHKLLPLNNSQDEYLLSDNTTIPAHYFHAGGWCGTCNDYRTIFSPKPLEEIKSEMVDIENRYNKSGFMGLFKEKPKMDIELWELNRKLLDILRRRENNNSFCCTCGGIKVSKLSINTLKNAKLQHPKCGGYFQIEEGIIIIGSNLAYSGTSFEGNESEVKKEFISSRGIVKGKLLDANDKFISYL